MTPSIIMAGQESWQRPARTEEWVWNRLKALEVSSPFFQFVSFPWATLIDLQRRGLEARAKVLNRKALELGPKQTLVRATLCQHIWAEDLLPLFKTLGITDLFWPHADKDKAEIDGIRIHPYPLFPVRAYEDLMPRRDLPLQNTRDILFNFIGAYDPQGYLTPVRQWILDLPASPNCVIRPRKQWHYETDVYERQIKDVSIPAVIEAQQKSHEQEYDDILSRSLFTLCPSGTGPNSIRLWEAIMFGSIPVLLSDSLQLPDEEAIWDGAILRAAETEEVVKALPQRLKDFAANETAIKAHQHRLGELRSQYIIKAAYTLISPLSQIEYIQSVTD